MTDRHPNKLIERELEAIDEALANDRPTTADPQARELQELGLALRADAPEADPGFSARLGERVRQGFPPEPGSARARLRGLRPPRLRRPSLPVLAGVTSVLLAVAVAVPLLTGGEDDSAEPGGALSAPAERSLGDELNSGAAEPQATQPLPPRGDGFEPGRRQRIERSASLTLAAPEAELERIAAQVNTVTDRFGGYVSRSNLATGEDGSSGGSFELRIPQARLQPALRDLAALGEVRSRSQTGEDITREVATTSDRLEAARAERRSLLRRLERADSDAQAEAIRRRLDLVAGEIRNLRSQLRQLRLRTDYAAVSVSLVAEEDDRGGSVTPGSTGEAVDDALGSLVGAVNLALRVLGVAIPIGLLALLAWSAARVARRRRRESALA